MYALDLDEILDETNQLDIGNKNKHWLAIEVRNEAGQLNHHGLDIFICLVWD